MSQFVYFKDDLAHDIEDGVFQVDVTELTEQIDYQIAFCLTKTQANAKRNGIIGEELFNTLDELKAHVKKNFPTDFDKLGFDVIEY